jgi:hypothetical protein
VQWKYSQARTRLLANGITKKTSLFAKKRVLLSDIRIKGRLPTEQTLALWGITVHEVIDAYRVHMEKCQSTLETPKKLAEFRILVGNML